MEHLNVEIKARCSNQAEVRALLLENGAESKGTDHQIDTYFQVPNGRLKLREGEIENALVYYQISNQAGPKQSAVSLFHTTPGTELKAVLTKALDILAVVDKTREIYFINNVKFHIDNVEGLGSFVEIEAIDTHAKLGKEKLNEQCQFYLELFKIPATSLIAESYSDMLLQTTNPST